MDKTSLEVSRQFRMSNSNLVSVIEKLIKRRPAIKNNFRIDHYIDKQKRQQVMYYINDFGYSILLNWFLNKRAS